MFSTKRCMKKFMLWQDLPRGVSSLCLLPQTNTIKFTSILSKIISDNAGETRRLDTSFTQCSDHSMDQVSSSLYKPALVKSVSSIIVGEGLRSSTISTEDPSPSIPSCMTPMLVTSLPWPLTSILTGSLRENWTWGKMLLRVDWSELDTWIGLVTIPPLERSTSLPPRGLEQMLESSPGFCSTPTTARWVVSGLIYHLFYTTKQLSNA